MLPMQRTRTGQPVGSGPGGIGVDALRAGHAGPTACRTVTASSLRIVFACMLAVFRPIAAQAGEAATGSPPTEANADFTELSLEELSSVRVNTATIRDAPWMSQPATLSVFRSEEIAALGARTLEDVLAFTPGMAFGVDVFGVSSLIVRGQWAHEGKVLLLLDDMPLNDLLYGNVNLASHYPAEQIERVEIVRGAGATKYGGNAQLAVIRIHTRAAHENGTTVHVGTQQMDGADLGWDTTITTTHKSDELAFVLSGHIAQAPYSGDIWHDTGDASIDLGETTGIDAYNLLAKLDWRDLRLQAFIDDHLSETPQKFGTGVEGEEVRFSSVNWSAAYELRVGESVVLTPRISQRYQEDWFIDRDAATNPTVDFFLPVRATRASLEAQTEFAHVDVLTGLEYFNESASCRSPGGPPGVRDPETYFNGSPSVRYDSVSAFAQADWIQDSWMFSLGTRYSDHSYAGSSLVPRLAVAYNRGDWHIKTVLGQAFREPDIEVINSSDFGAAPIKPETTTQAEIEFGWKPDARTFGSIALFEMRIADPIIYSSNGTDYDYTNNDTVTTRGVELDWRTDLEAASLHLGYSYYQSVSTNDLYAVPVESSSNIGAPRHKAFASIEAPITRSGWHVRASAVWYGQIHAYDYDATASDFQGNPLAVRQLSDQLLVNLGARWTRNGWSVALGVNNILGADRLLPQPYHGESTPYPGAGRASWLKIGRSW